jgi:hypothetical protein
MVRPRPLCLPILGLEINGNQSRPLLIFTSRMEKDSPRPDASGVHYFAPG